MESTGAANDDEAEKSQLMLTWIYRFCKSKLTKDGGFFVADDD